MRRHPVSLLSVVFAATLTLAACDAAEPPKPLGITTEGLVEGVANDGLHIYRGVPFASPPSEAAGGRFRDSARPRTRNKPLAATAPAPACPQPPELYSNATSAYKQSEDCLYVDIWTPAESADEALPVLFWVHGGGLVRGTPSRPDFDPSELSRRGIVVVAVRYRLGALGFLAHPALEVEGPSGTYGLRDVLRALKWTHSNAGAFGGDPARITLSGHSAGAASLLPLMASAEATSLYVAAILHSPVVDPLSETGRADEYADRTQQLETGEGAARALGATTADELRLLDAAAWANSGFEPRLSLDGETFEASFRDAVATGALGRRRLLIGSTINEAALFLPLRELPKSEEELRSRVGDAVVPMQGTLAQRYAAYVGNEGFEAPIRRVADAASTAGWGVYAYRFGGVGGQAVHGEDARLLVDNTAPATPAAAKLRAAVQAYWASFIRDGEPRSDAEGAVHWPSYDTKARRHVVLGSDIHSEKSKSR